ncbi:MULTISPECIES: saccharopine dehydrogenase NADP-binding domain-containing protein [Mumia]|uniref:saccharopine dehydrogenase NADP-binding domain-containing protein n=1 Tax=Mumia TaxID=1546255 RepID=UPI0014202B33|nr:MULTISPECIES: saccharopine dehydrogenase NADP-binding domain-containing protein [unclassified Mumia]QMW65392.1 saccharopine dehydrogenase NADP-binding domain-containing protein [Mumia sp. ZJ1417]
MTSSSLGPVVVYGAYGHTGRFVVDELLRRGLTPILSGRDETRLEAMRAGRPGLEIRPARVDDPASLRGALSGAAAVINVAGPFLDTGVIVSEAAVAAGAHYLDVTAEQPAVEAVYAARAADAEQAGVAVIPAMAFYGGLADLLATAVLAGETEPASLTVAIGLDRWWPTAGTRLTGTRNTAPRRTIVDGRLAPLPDSVPRDTWHFTEGFEQAVVAVPFSEPVLIARHLPVDRLYSYLSASALSDIRDPATPPPPADDDRGRSSQQFVVDVVAQVGAQTHRIAASGRDIYAATAPLIVEATARLLDGRATRTGVVAPGEVFDAEDFLRALTPNTLTLRREVTATGRDPQAMSA